jgi:hypothetical protein
MNETVTPKRPLVLTVILVAAGLVFTTAWIYIHIIWAAMAGAANLMANDSGNASLGAWGGLIGGMFVGQVIAASAGIPGGLAFFWRGRRWLFMLLFAILVIAGALCQIASFHSFFSDAGSK